MFEVVSDLIARSARVATLNLILNLAPAVAQCCLRSAVRMLVAVVLDLLRHTACRKDPDVCAFVNILSIRRQRKVQAGAPAP